MRACEWGVCSPPCFSADGGVSWTLLHFCLLFRVLQRFLFVSRQHTNNQQHDSTCQTLRTERVAAWSRCMLMNQRSAACFSRVLFMDTNMFRVSVSLITADVLWWSSAGRVFACTIVFTSLSADRDACLFSLGEFHLELLQPSRSDNPTALNSARCWKCYGDVTAATLSLWRQDFMENRLWRFFRPETER